MVVLHVANKNIWKLNLESRSVLKEKPFLIREVIANLFKQNYI